MIPKTIISIVVFLFLINSDTEAASKNDTQGACVFAKMKRCYDLMPSMGGRMGNRFAQSLAEVQGNCVRYADFKTCLYTPWCPKMNLNKTMNKISSYVNNLCFVNKTKMSFINASKECYNANFTQIRQCLVKYDPGTKNDTRTLCKSNMNTVACVKGVVGKCKRYASFLKDLISTYNSYVPQICGTSGLQPISLWIMAILCIIVLKFSSN